MSNLTPAMEAGIADLQWSAPARHHDHDGTTQYDRGIRFPGLLPAFWTCKQAATVRAGRLVSFL